MPNPTEGFDESKCRDIHSDLTCVGISVGAANSLDYRFLLL